MKYLQERYRNTDRAPLCYASLYVLMNDKSYVVLLPNIIT